MPDFEIKITTPSELAGAQASLAALQGQIKASELLGKNIDGLVEKETKLRQAIIQSHINDITGGGKPAKDLEDTGKAAGEAGEDFKILGKGAHGAHAVLHALNQAMPGLTQFARFLQSGFTAAIGVALLAYEYLNSKIEEFNKLVDDLGGSDNAAGGWAKKLAENMRDSHIAADVLTHDIQRILDAQERVATSTDDLIERQKKQAEAANTVADAQKELEEARVDLAEKLGEITPEESIRIKLDIDEEDFRRKQEAKIAGIKAELQARQHEQTALGGRGGDLDRDQQAVDRSRAAADAANAAKTKNDTLLDNARKNLEAAKEDQKKADERLEQPHRWGDRADTFERDLAEKASESASNKIGQFKKEIGQYEKKETALGSAGENAKNDLQEAIAQWKDDAKAANELNKTIANLTATLAGAQAESSALISIHNQAAQTRADIQNAPIENARRAILLRRALSPDQGAGEVETERNQFNQLSEEAGNAMNQVTEASRMHGFGSPAIGTLVALVQKLTVFLKQHPAIQPAAHDDMQQEIHALQRDIAVLISRHAMDRNGP